MLSGRVGLDLARANRLLAVVEGHESARYIDLAMNSRTNPQMRNWCFLALQEITDEKLPADAIVWNRWYQEHGAEKMAQFERLDWWQVRGDE
jgi:hypothetical protein